MEAMTCSFFQAPAPLVVFLESVWYKIPLNFFSSLYNEAKMKFFCKYKCSHDKLRGFLAVKVIIFSVP